MDPSTAPPHRLPALTALTRLMPPPTDRRRDIDWSGVERDFGCLLPEDYRQFCDLYGEGCLDSFVWVLVPRCPNAHLDLHTQFVRRLEALNSVQASGERVPYRIDVGDSASLMPWAITDNGDVCFWDRSAGADPNRWTVTVNEARGPDWHEFEGQAVQFLVELLARRVRCEVFPDDWPTDAPDFRPESPLAD